MALTTSVKLEGRREAHGAPFDEIVLREPPADLYLELGEPEGYQPSQGGPMLVVYDEIVHEYLKRCVVPPEGTNISGADMLSELSLREVRLVRQQFLTFFFNSLVASLMRLSPSLSDTADGSQATSETPPSPQ